MTTRTRGSTRCSPRFSTPRVRTRRTLGPAVGEVARRLGMPLMPWQQSVVDVALELDGDGSYHYDELVLTIPRQAGKSTLVFAMVVHRLVVVSRELGRQRVTYTAQLRQKARLKLERDFAQILRDAPAFREITHIRNKPARPTEWKLSLNNGLEHILFGRGNYLQIDAPSRTGGHGDSLDVGVIDEAFAHEDDTIETGMAPSMATRPNRQTWVVSTAGDGRSFYLWRKVLAGRRACESGEHGRTAYFEWSADDDADPGDPATWWSCSPALGLTIDERFLEGEWEKALRDGEEGVGRFCRSYLNLWPDVPILDDSLLASTALDLETWHLSADVNPERGKDVVFGVDVDGGRLAHVAVAWRRRDGKIQVQLTRDPATGQVDSGLSPLATPPRLSALAKSWKGRVVLGGPAASLEGDVPRAVVIPSTEFAAAFGRVVDLLGDDRLRHGNQAALNEAVRLARSKPFGSAGERSLQLKDAPSIGPLAAVVRAVHGLVLAPKKPVARVSASVVAGRARLSGSEPDIATMSF